MMLVVVDRHRLRVDVRLERVGGVRQGRNLVGHGACSPLFGGLVAGLYPRRLAPLTRDPLSQLLLPDRARAARRRRGDLAQAHGARRAHPPGRLGPVVVAARGLARAPEGRADRARGDRRDRRRRRCSCRSCSRPSRGGAPGRYEIDELFKLKDRKGADMVLAMTHEECVTTHVAQVVRSYRDLPFSLYHFQVKERDEPRPRAGVLRTREFIMKDAYTLRPRRARACRRSYDELRRAPTTGSSSARGLEWYSVESDVGMMGGSGAHEYMAPCAAGENEVALAPGLRRQRRGRQRRPAARRPARAAARARAPCTRRARRRSTTVARMLGVPRGRAAEGVPDRRRRRAAASCSCSCAAITASTRSSSPTRSARRGARRATRRSPSGSARPASSARSAPNVPVLLDDGRRRRRLRRRRQRARPPPARRRARPRLRLRARRRAHGRGRRHRRRPADHDRARDRGRQHLPARHALLRAARRDLPRRGAARERPI